MNTERLKILADFLLTVPENQFDIEIWHKENECGTVACAAGWACTIPEFNAAGLSLELDGKYCGCPVYRGVVAGDFALNEFFNIQWTIRNSIFYPSGYPEDKKITPRDVASKIYKILEDAA